MQRVLTGQSMAQAEKQAYADGASEEIFMDTAGKNLSAAITDYCSSEKLGKNAILLAGKGNNGGDGFVVASHLLLQGFHIEACLPVSLDQCSLLCKKNAERFLSQGGKIHADYQKLKESCAFFIDAIFGTGFKGEISSPFKEAVEFANRSNKPILAIDIPSGLNSTTGDVESVAIKATATFYLECPKQGFFLSRGWDHIGELYSVPFGLRKSYLDNAESTFDLLIKQDAMPLLPPVIPSRHKYSRGSVAAIAGSAQYPGAGELSSFASLRAGAGIVKQLHFQETGRHAHLHPEVIHIDFEDLETMYEQVNKASACMIGPGIGQSSNMKSLLLDLLSKKLPPCVVDADALTILAGKSTLPPKNALLTPHKGEMDRLLHDSSPSALNVNYLKRCRAYAEKSQTTIILKGGPTFIIAPQKRIAISPFGSPAMATAGSGDVLTGILAAMLAQGLTAYQAAILGCTLHGLAGASAARKKTSYSVVASDIIEELPSAFKELL